LQLAAFGHGARVDVVYKHHPVADKHSVFNRHPFANEAVTRDLTVTTNGSALLNPDKRADLRAVANRSTFEFYQSAIENLHTLFEYNVVCDHA